MVDPTNQNRSRGSTTPARTFSPAGFHRLPDKTGKMVRVIQPEIRIVHPLVGHALFLHRVPDRPLHPLVLLLVGRKLHESRELHLRRVADRSHLIQIIPEGVIQISPTTTVKYHRVIRLRLDHRFRLVLVVTTTTSNINNKKQQKIGNRKLNTEFFIDYTNLFYLKIVNYRSTGHKFSGKIQVCAISRITLPLSDLSSHAN